MQSFDALQPPQNNLSCSSGDFLCYGLASAAGIVPPCESSDVGHGQKNYTGKIEDWSESVALSVLGKNTEWMTKTCVLNVH